MRRANKRNTITISFCATEELIDAIDTKAANLNISRSTLISSVMEQNIREEGLSCLHLSNPNVQA